MSDTERPQSSNITTQLESVKYIQVAQKKSMAAALVLTFFFGPLGLFYASIIGGIIMLALSVFVLIFTLGFGFLFTWPITMIWAAIAVDRANRITR